MNAHSKSFQVSRRALLRGGGALTVAFALSGPADRVLAQAAAGAAGRILDPKEVDAFLCDQCRRHRHGVLRQGRSRPGLADRDPADRSRRTRHRRRQGAFRRGRYRAHARSGPHLRLDRHHARRHADSSGGGDRAQGIDRARLEASQRAGRKSRDRRRHRASGGRRTGRDIRRTARGQEFRSEARSESAAEGSEKLHAGRQVAEAAGHRGEMHRQPPLYAELRTAQHAACAGDPAAGRRRHAAIGRREFSRAICRA